MNINPADIRVDTFRAPNSSAWIRSNDVCVRVTHTPTGIYAESTEQRSQHANRAAAFDTLLNLLGSQTDYTKQMELGF
jgi:protein subunit release factor A